MGKTVTIYIFLFEIINQKSVKNKCWNINHLGGFEISLGEWRMCIVAGSFTVEIFFPPCDFLIQYRFQKLCHQPFVLILPKNTFTNITLMTKKIIFLTNFPLHNNQSFGSEKYTKGIINFHN